MKIYKSAEERLVDQEKYKQEMLMDLHEMDNGIRKDRKRKRFRIIGLIIVLFILFKVFIGEIKLFLPVYYYNRLYEATLNEKPITVCVEEYRKTPIIPFVISNNYAGFYCYHQGDMGTDTHTFNRGDKISITIDSFECLSSFNNAKISCYQNENPRKRKTHDTKYTLVITKVNREGTVMYKGDFVNDITDYFPEKGIYDVNMIARHGNVKSTVFFGIKIVD